MSTTTLFRGFLACSAILLIGVHASAQVRYTSILDDQSKSTAPAGNPPAANVDAPGVPQIFSAPATPRFYAGAEYLFWWMKSAPLPLPIISSGPLDTEIEGLLSTTAASTYILYGSPFPNGIGGYNKQNFPAFNGTRLTLGGYLDDDQRVGIEGSAFLFEHKPAGFQTASDSTGSPRLHLLSQNAVYYAAGGGFVPAGLEDALPISVHNAVAGHVEITNSLRLWGASGLGTFTFFRGNALEVTALGGFRYLDLYEAFDLSATLVGIGADSANGRDFSGQYGTLADHFQTRNQFYGGTLGLQTRYHYGSWLIEASARVSLGSSHDVLNVAGGFNSVNYPRSGEINAGTEGFYAQPANEGRTAKNVFSVVPEAQLKISYALTSWLRASVGYEYLYMSQVVRPADQIDRHVPNGQTFQQNADTASGIPIVSTTYPAKQFVLRDFYANGLTFSLEFRY